MREQELSSFTLNEGNPGLAVNSILKRRVKTEPSQKESYHGNSVCEPQFLCSLPPVEP